jgi:hypothetical protein
MIHSAALWKIINLRGGLDSLTSEGSIMKDLLAILDLCRPIDSCPMEELASSLLRRPQELHYLSHSFDRLLSPKTTDFPSNIRALILLQHINIDLAHCVAALHRIFQSARSSAIIEFSSLAKITIPIRQCLDQLLHSNNDPIGDDPSPSRRSVQFEIGVCLALIIVSNRICNYPGNDLATEELSRALYAMCEERFWIAPEPRSESWRLEYSCIAWVFMIVAEARDLDTNTRFCQTLMAAMFDIVEEIAPGNWQRNCDDGYAVWAFFEASVLKQFLYPSFPGAQYRECWMKHWRIRKEILNAAAVSSLPTQCLGNVQNATLWCHDSSTSVLLSLTENTIYDLRPWPDTNIPFPRENKEAEWVPTQWFST